MKPANLNGWERACAGFVLAGFSQLGCSSLANGNDIAKTGDLTEDPQWGCIQNGVPPAVPDPIPSVIHYVVPIIDFTNQPSQLKPDVFVPGALIPNLRVTVCPANDPTCPTPVPAPVTTPTALPYVYQIDIPGGLDAVFLRITEFPPSDSMLAQHIPLVYYFAGSLVGNQAGGDTIKGEAIPVPTFGGAAGLFADFNLMPDFSKGIIAVRTIDCLGHRAAGVTLMMTPSSTMDVSLGYTLTDQGVPLRNDPNQPSPTDTRGVAGFANVPPGGVQVFGLPPNGIKYGNSIARIAPSQFTLVEVRPDTLRPR